ncbi:MAG: hypothetical protein HY017_28710 [Betaproteobacteria bacterium]|nr:hypothetical protein [Betaproteobacteria bacterium]
MNVGAEVSQRSAEYEVLSPWADADPVPSRGITSRPRDLAGKKIGLYLNHKRAGHLSLSAFERELLERVPSATTSWYPCTGHNVPEMLTEGKAKFEAWVGSVDAVVLSVAD